MYLLRLEIKVEVDAVNWSTNVTLVIFSSPNIIGCWSRALGNDVVRTICWCNLIVILAFRLRDFFLIVSIPYV